MCAIPKDKSHISGISTIVGKNGDEAPGAKSPKSGVGNDVEADLIGKEPGFSTVLQVFPGDRLVIVAERNGPCADRDAKNRGNDNQPRCGLTLTLGSHCSRGNDDQPRCGRFWR